MNGEPVVFFDGGLGTIGNDGRALHGLGGFTLIMVARATSLGGYLADWFEFGANDGIAIEHVANFMTFKCFSALDPVVKQ